MGFTQMTPVQASVMPLFMKNKDVVVEVGLSALLKVDTNHRLKANTTSTGCYRVRQDSVVRHPDSGASSSAGDRTWKTRSRGDHHQSH